MWGGGADATPATAGDLFVLNFHSDYNLERETK
jgi:hypothetical protein